MTAPLSGSGLPDRHLSLTIKKYKMKEFMMIFRNHTNPGAEKPSAEQMQAEMKKWQNWIGGIAAQGKYSGTNRLSSDGSKTLKSNNVITDGPYAEVKEIIGGYLIVKANELDEAVEMAKGCPSLGYGGSVEIRTVVSMDFDSKS
jgi:hypothetical protein